MNDGRVARFENVYCLEETKDAVLVQAEDDDVFSGEKVWVPKSVVDDDSEVYSVGDRGEFIIKAWFASKKGWES